MLAVLIIVQVGEPRDPRLCGPAAEPRPRCCTSAHGCGQAACLSLHRQARWPARPAGTLAASRCSRGRGGGRGSRVVSLGPGLCPSPASASCDLPCEGQVKSMVQGGEKGHLSECTPMGLGCGMGSLVGPGMLSQDPSGCCRAL